MDLDTIAASVAGAVGSKIVFHPLDTLRTLQQTSTNFSYVLPFRRYWSGLGAAVALTTPAFTVYMVSYRQCKRQLTPYFGEDSIANYVVSGGVSEIASSFLWTPMEVIKGRMQIHNSAKPTSTFQLMNTIYHQEGVRGFFRGYWMGVGVFLPHTIVWWITYEKAKTFLGERHGQHELSAGEFALASATGSTVAATLSNFLDVVKTRQQLAVSEEIARLRPDDQASIARVIRNLVSEVGVFRALFKGLHVRLLNTLPSSILAMVIVEKIDPDRKKKQTY